jgi:hypothetical protein
LIETGPWSADLRLAFLRFRLHRSPVGRAIAAAEQCGDIKTVPGT